jgi:hypothetical protein
MNAHSLRPADASFVIPVRYVAGGNVVHATSMSLTVDDVRVRSATPPPTGAAVELKLYPPEGIGVITRRGVIAEAGREQFRARFTDSDELARRRISELLWRRELGLRPCPRFHTSLRAQVVEGGKRTLGGEVTNISRSGAFVRLPHLPARGSVVELRMELPDFAGFHTVQAYVVHEAPGRGIGVQFIGAADAFSRDLEAYLARLSV